MDDEIRCWICGSTLVAKDSVTMNGEVKIFITCDSCFTDLIVIGKGSNMQNADRAA